MLAKLNQSFYVIYDYIFKIKSISYTVYDTYQQYFKIEMQYENLP